MNAATRIASDDSPYLSYAEWHDMAYMAEGRHYKLTGPGRRTLLRKGLCSEDKKLGLAMTPKGERAFQDMETRAARAMFSHECRHDQPVHGQRYVMGIRKGRAVAWAYSVTMAVYEAILTEATNLGIEERPVIVYGFTCLVHGPAYVRGKRVESIRFEQQQAAPWVAS